MEKKRSCLRAGPLTILWGLLAILLCGASSLHAEDIDYPVTGLLFVSGTTNLLTGASVSEAIYVESTGILNMYSGSIGTKTIYADPAGIVNIYGTDLDIDGTGLVTGTYEDESPIEFSIDGAPSINLIDIGGSGPLDITIDIKPGSSPNAINLGSNGVVPVAILSTDAFDAATEIDPDTVELAGASVAVRGKGSKLLASVEDVNGDGLLDLVVKVDTQNLDPGTFQDGWAILTASGYDGTAYEGSDEIIIVPPE